MDDGVLDDLTSPAPRELAEPLELLIPLRFLSVALVDELSASLAPRELPTTSREGTFLLQLEVVARRIFPKTGIPDEFFELSEPPLDEPESLDLRGLRIAMNLQR